MILITVIQLSSDTLLDFGKLEVLGWSHPTGIRGADEVLENCLIKKIGGLVCAIYRHVHTASRAKGVEYQEIYVECPDDWGKIKLKGEGAGSMFSKNIAVLAALVPQLEKCVKD